MIIPAKRIILISFYKLKFNLIEITMLYKQTFRPHYQQTAYANKPKVIKEGFCTKDCHNHDITFSSLYLILSSAFSNFRFFFPLMPRQRGSLLLAIFLLCFSFFLFIFSLFFVIHLCFFGGSTLCVSNLGLPSDIMRLTEPWLKFLQAHKGLGWLSERKHLVILKIDSWAWKFDLEYIQMSRKGSEYNIGRKEDFL